MNGTLDTRGNASINRKPAANGLAKGPIQTPAAQARRKPTCLAMLLGNIARLSVWYAIATIVFRCPSDLSSLTDDSPRLCKPYLSLRSHIDPHLKPSYNAYLKPYVDRSQPHIDRLNEQIYTPAADFAKRKYALYAAPRVHVAQKYIDDEWSTTLAPKLEAGKQWISGKYDETLSPHVSKAIEASDPYVTKAQETITDTYDTTLVPLYARSLPYFQRAWQQGHHVTAHVLFPYLQAAQSTTSSFLTRQVWPRLVILYGENVEPQLVRISERLGRYKDSKRLQAAIHQVEISSSITSVAAKASSAASASVQSEASTMTSTESSAASQTPNAAEIREKIATDLKTWQEKFAKAADKGAEDLELRVKEIINRQIDTQARTVGNALVLRLEETVQKSLKDVKSHINKSVSKLPTNPTEDEEDAAYEEILSSIKYAGTDIRSQAIAVRAWKQKYDNETNALIDAALTSTLDVIDNIRDLGLQEIGMRWAWMEGVTYKDWSKYHALKKTFDEWRDEVSVVALQHEGLAKAKEEGEAVQDKAMQKAEEAAKELARLKDVAKWKTLAHDSSDDFSSKVSPARAVKAAKSIVSEASKAIHDAASSLSNIVGTESKPVASSVADSLNDGVKSAKSIVSQGSKSVNNAASSASSNVAARDPEASGSSAIEDLKKKVNQAAHAASSSASEASSALSQSASTVGDSAGEAASSASSQVAKQYPKASASSESEALKDSVGSPAGEADTVGSKASIAMSKSASELSSSLNSASAKASSSLSSASSAASNAASSGTSQASVWGGAMASYVDGKEIVLDHELDGDSWTEQLSSIIDEAGEKAADLTKAISEALVKPASTKGTVESATSLASEQYLEAWSAASSALYGTPQPFAESVSGVVSDKYAQAVTAASYAIYGTPAPALESLASLASAAYSGAASNAQDILSSITSAASVRLADSISQASVQYTNAKIAVGAQPPPLHQQYSAEARHRYYEGIGIAHDQYSSFTRAASSAIYGTPTPFYESLASAASLKLLGTPAPAYEAAVDSAKSQYNAAVSAASQNLGQVLASASSLAGMTSKSPARSIIDSASSQYNAAISQASEALVAAASSASIAAYGTPVPQSIASVVSENVIGSETPWSESVASQAAQNYESLISKASEQIYGEPTPFHASVWSQAGGYAAQATDVAASHYAAVQAVFSELVIGKEPDFTESAMSRLSSAYYTGAAAAASSASSYGSEVYGSASSVISSVFTPPATLEAILDSASKQLSAAVEAASIQLYGTSLGPMEKASSAAANGYSSVSARASVAVYGTQPSALEAAQSSIADLASSAQAAISEAIYGTSTGAAEAATSSIASAYSSISSVAGKHVGAAADAIKDTYSSASASISSAVHGPEKGALESASSRLAAAAESASARLSSMAAEAVGAAGEGVAAARSGLEDAASSVSSIASAVTSRVKDEL